MSFQENPWSISADGSGQSRDRVSSATYDGKCSILIIGGCIKLEECEIEKEKL